MIKISHYNLCHIKLRNLLAAKKEKISKFTKILIGPLHLLILLQLSPRCLGLINNV